MCNGSIFSGVIKYTVPIICTSILQLLFNAADLVVVGRFCGSNSVGAVGATSSVVHMFVNLFIGTATGVSVTVANAIGKQDENRVSKVVDENGEPLVVYHGSNHWFNIFNEEKLYHLPKSGGRFSKR